MELKVGDIFTSQAEWKVVPVNCVGVMGKGLALTFKNKYPEMYQAYRKEERILLYHRVWGERGDFRDRGDNLSCLRDKKSSPRRELKKPQSYKNAKFRILIQNA